MYEVTFYWTYCNLKKKCTNVYVKGCDSNFEENIFQFLRVSKNKTSTLHQTICSWIALEIYNNNDQQFNRHDFNDNSYLGPLAL